MPCRLIRDELLESERVLALPIEARWLYVTILLSADDLGLFEATSFKLARRSDIRREAGEQLLSMLADADLVRLYEANGKRYGFIPRFRQRIQIKFLKHPAPPEALMYDDEDALNKIKHLASKTTVGQPMGNGDATDAQPSEAKAKAKEEAKENILTTGKEERRAARAQAVACPADVDAQVWADWCQLRRAKRATVTLTVVEGARKEAAKAGMPLQEFLAIWCRRGSQGLEAAWLKPEEKQSALTKRGEAVRSLMSGLTSGMIGGGNNVKLIG